MSRTYQKATCPHCGKPVSMAGGAYWRHVEKCKTNGIKPVKVTRKTPPE